MADTQVLIAGAGPTGLVLALGLQRRGIRVRIIDKIEKVPSTSRALAVQSRTLEFYQQLGFADEVVNKGHRFAGVNFWARGRKVARAALADIGQGLSPYPFLLIFPQDEHEDFLIEKLAAVGVKVERETELLDFKQEGSKVLARICNADGKEEVCTVDYLAGCDGANSIVRKTLHSEFVGSTYSQLFYVADVRVKNPAEAINGELQVALDKSDFLAIFPLKEKDHARLVGTVTTTDEEKLKNLQWKDVSHNIISELKIDVAEVTWFSTYHVHHRLAETFQKDRIFLLGDAAHIHSPVGGQGMNTGIGDAINLAWKISDVIHKRLSPETLETYSVERKAFAKRLVATTDQVFNMASSTGVIAEQMRLRVVPVLFPFLLKFHFVRSFLYHTVSQIDIKYRHSELSQGHVGSLHGGDRLPWLGDNFEPLKNLDWQIHVYGKAVHRVVEEARDYQLPLYEFPWKASAMSKAGFVQNAAYLIRPDGYIGVIDANRSGDELRVYLKKHFNLPHAEKKSWEVHARDWDLSP